MTKLKFEELSLSREILDAVKDMGFEEASPIQSETIPLLLDGKDIIGQAQTGTGKTAAFAIPIIEKLDPESKEIQAVILCPTRELVIQVSEEFRKLMKYRENLFVIPIYGGQQIERQLRALKKGAQIIIGTPGRMMDHMRRGSIKMHSVRTVVLDEGDEMLDMGFRDDIEVILKDTSEQRQTIMFSATMPKEIIDMTGKYLKNPVIVNVTHKKLSAPKIQQAYFEVQEKNKPELLSRLIDLHNIKLALVFCNTKSQVDQLVEILKTRGYFADALHGDMSQNYRDKVMNGFRNGTVEILVATDVAGRGIDVNNVEAVFNYDLPRDDEDYIHRIGRTARAGKTGLAFTFIVGKQIYNLKRIEKINGLQIHRQTVPTIDELQSSKINSYASKINEIIEAGHLSNYINQIELLMGEELTSLDVAAALFKIIIEKENVVFDDSVVFEESFKEETVTKKRYSDRYSDRRANSNNSRRDFGKSRSNGEFKPFKSADKKKQDSSGEFKPFKSADKKKQDSSGEFKPFKYSKPKKDSEEKFEFENKPSRSSGKKKNNSFKERYNKPNKENNNTPSRKTGSKPVKKKGA